MRFHSVDAMHITLDVVSHISARSPMRIASIAFLVAFTLPVAAQQHCKQLDKLTALTSSALQVHSLAYLQTMIPVQ